MSQKLITLLAPPPAPLTPAENTQLGRELTGLFHDAVEGHMRVLAFGAKFMEVEERVTTCGIAKQGNKAREGTGMKAWLKEHASEISSTSAYRFRDITEAVAKFHKIKQPSLVFCSPVLELSPADQKKRAKVVDYMTEKSLRQVQMELGLITPPQRGGYHPSANPEAGPKEIKMPYYSWATPAHKAHYATLTREQRKAWICWMPVCVDIQSDLCSGSPHWPCLSDPDKNDLIATLEEFLAKLSPRSPALSDRKNS